MQQSSSVADGISSGCSQVQGYRAEASQASHDGTSSRDNFEFPRKQVRIEGSGDDEHPDICMPAISPFSVQDPDPTSLNEDDIASLFPPIPTKESVYHRDSALAQLARHYSGPLPTQSDSFLLSEIADEVSRTFNEAAQHSRNSSADSQDSWQGKGSRKRKWRLNKAASVSNPMAYQSRGSPSGSSNWASWEYHEDESMPILPKTEPSPFEKDVGVARRYRIPRKKYTGRHRTSKYIGVGSSNRKNQWQARILVHGKVTHLGYYPSEEGAAMVYDRVALSMNAKAATNFPLSRYSKFGEGEFQGLGREDLQRALGVKPMDKSSRFRGVSRKKGKWEAKVMVNRRWAYRALFDSEDEAAHAYDDAVRRLKPKEAKSFVNFKDGELSGNSLAAKPRPTQRRKSLPIINRSLSCGFDSAPVSEDAATLTAMHIPKWEMAESEAALRRHSVQLPISLPMEEGSTDKSSSAMPPIPLGTAHSYPDLIQELPLPSVTNTTASPNRAFSRQSSVTQLASVPVVPLVDLPDPNSIGVPPPENLPYPELVQMPEAVGQLSQRSSLGLPPSPHQASTTARPPSRLAYTCPPLDLRHEPQAKIPPLHGLSEASSGVHALTSPKVSPRIRPPSLLTRAASAGIVGQLQEVPVIPSTADHLQVTAPALMYSVKSQPAAQIREAACGLTGMDLQQSLSTGSNTLSMAIPYTIPPPSVFPHHAPSLQGCGFSTSALSQLDSVASFNGGGNVSALLPQAQQLSAHSSLHRSASSIPAFSSGPEMYAHLPMPAPMLSSLQTALSLDSVSVTPLHQAVAPVHQPVLHGSVGISTANHAPESHASASDLLAAMGVDLDMPDAPMRLQSVQIGGEDLPLYGGQSG